MLHVRRLWIGLFLSGLVLAAAAYLTRSWWQTPIQPHPVADPRLTFSTPYENVRPEIAYVGDEACSRCHPGIAEKYRLHPMGRAAALAKVEPSATFRVGNYEYRVERENGQPVHREIRKAADGTTLVDMARPVRFVVGSGTRGRGYLLEDGGFVFQSPISWYAGKNVWDLSPGYHSKNQHFDRPITAECLFCHSNRAEPMPNAVNQFRPGVFEGLAIGCERCHGPGSLHVQRQEASQASAGNDTTIVNPKRLEPLLRESVCQQCHLQGQARTLRRGRQVYDYRPGLPLQLFWSVSVWAPGREPLENAVGQVEEMTASRCYQASAGKLGCISCHDPHERPSEATAVAHYRSRCLNCHGERGCSVPEATRRKATAQDSCIVCHMPQRGARDVLHVSVTDHTVPRRGRPPRTEPPPLPPDELPIVHFYRDQLPADDPEIPRALGLAVLQVANGTPADARHFMAAQALPRIEQALAGVGNDDFEALEGKATALLFLDRLPEAAAAIDLSLKLAPRRENALDVAALIAEGAGKTSEALKYRQRAAAVNPARSVHHFHLARLLAVGQRWREALASCETVLRLDPNNLETRNIQIACLIELGDKKAARSAYDELLAFDPPNRADLRRRYEAKLR